MWGSKYNIYSAERLKESDNVEYVILEKYYNPLQGVYQYNVLTNKYKIQSPKNK